MKLNKILIYDGSYLLQRALHTPGLAELCTKDGIKTGGVYGFLKVFQAEIKRFPDYYPVVCWDGGLSTRRTQIYSDYKANRKRISADNLVAHGIPLPKDDYLEEYHRQRGVIISILGSMGVTSLLLPKWEGDDLQYLLTLISNDSVIVSDDKDMIQLVSPTCRIRRSMRDELISWNATDTYNHHPRFTIRKAITGDTSDNIPSVCKGIGEKTADKIAVLLENTLFDFYKETLEGYIKEKPDDALSPKIQMILANWTQFLVNYELINLREVEIPPTFAKIVEEVIVLTSNKIDVFKAYRILGENQIEKIYPDQIIRLIVNAKTFLEGVN